MNSITDLFEKYHLDSFDETLELRGNDKVNFVDDLNSLLSSVCRLFDKLTTVFSLRGGQVLMSLAKLQGDEDIISKTDILKCLNLDRREKLIHAFDYLLEQNYIKIKKKTSKFHIVNLNEEDNPDFKLLMEIVQRFWTSPQEEKDKAKSWSGIE